MMKNRIHETVLYYTPVQSDKVRKLKGVLVRMGVRIKNVTAEQAGETVGALLGLPGYAPGQQEAETQEAESQTAEYEVEKASAVLNEEILVMHKFSSQRLDELLLNLRKAGVPKIELKAVVTDANAGWTFARLYEEIKEEHDKMSQ